SQTQSLLIRGTWCLRRGLLVLGALWRRRRIAARCLRNAARCWRNAARARRNVCATFWFYKTCTRRGGGGECYIAFDEPKPTRRRLADGGRSVGVVFFAQGERLVGVSLGNRGAMAGGVEDLGG